MKLQNIQNVEAFRSALDQCQGGVYLKSLEGDVFNLKSSLSAYIAIGALLGEKGDELELFADKREDEAILLHFLHQLETQA